MKLRSLVVASSLVVLAAPALSADPSTDGSVRPPPAHERLRDELRRRAAGLASGLPSALPIPSTVPAGSATPLPSRLKLEELARKWSERAATREERRARHRAKLLREVGKSLSQPSVRAEIELHARRVAELARLEFLAQNARAGAQRAALLARIAKLTQTEDRRHRLALQKLVSPEPTGAGSAAAPAPSSVSP